MLNYDFEEFTLSETYYCSLGLLLKSLAKMCANNFDCNEHGISVTLVFLLYNVVFVKLPFLRICYLFDLVVNVDELEDCTR